MASQIFLAPDVPNLQLQILVIDFFDVGTNGWLGHDDLAQGQFVKNRSFPTILHADNDNFDCFICLTCHFFPELGENEPHCYKI